MFHSFLGGIVSENLPHRKIEEEVLKCAAIVGKVRTTTLVAKIRERILRSDHPQGVIHMRKIDALRQVDGFCFPLICVHLHPPPLTLSLLTYEPVTIWFQPKTFKVLPCI
jgi:hypothetical protein